MNTAHPVYRIPGRFDIRSGLISAGLRVHNNSVLCRRDGSAAMLNADERTVTVIPNRSDDSDHIIDVMLRKFPAMRRVS